jgi:transposase
MICDSHGNPLDFVLTQGQVHDCTQSSILLTGWNAIAVIADKGYDDNKTRTNILAMGAEVVIPPRSCRKTPIEYDSHLYKARHVLENLFARLKPFRSLATRYDKTVRNFSAMVAIACILLWLRL